MITVALWLLLAALVGGYAGVKGLGRLRWALYALAGGPLTLAVLHYKPIKDPVGQLRVAEQHADWRDDKVEAAFAGLPNPASPIAPRQRAGVPLAPVMPFKPRKPKPALHAAAAPAGKQPVAARASSGQVNSPDRNLLFHLSKRASGIRSVGIGKAIPTGRIPL